MVQQKYRNLGIGMVKKRHLKQAESQVESCEYVNIPPMMIFRDDDICFTQQWTTIEKTGGLSRFKMVHDLFIKYGVLHTIAVIANRLEEAKDLVYYIKSNPLIDVQLHGWDHIDYPNNHDLVENHLKMSIETIEKLFGKKPTTFYPPWNRTDDFLENCAKKVGLTVSCKKIDFERYIGGIREPNVINFHYWADEVNLLESVLKLYKREYDERNSIAVVAKRTKKVNS